MCSTHINTQCTAIGGSKFIKGRSKREKEKEMSTGRGRDVAIIQFGMKNTLRNIDPRGSHLLTLTERGLETFECELGRYTRKWQGGAIENVARGKY